MHCVAALFQETIHFYTVKELAQIRDGVIIISVIKTSIFNNVLFFVSSKLLFLISLLLTIHPNLVSCKKIQSYN